MLILADISGLEDMGPGETNQEFSFLVEWYRVVIEDGKADDEKLSHQQGDGK